MCGSLGVGECGPVFARRVAPLLRRGRLRTVVEGAFGVGVHGEEVMDVRLMFSKNVAAYIRERVWHPSQEMKDRRDGSVEVRLKTAGWKDLVRWILSWQPDVKVLAPARLRERVEEKMRAGLGMGTGKTAECSTLNTQGSRKTD